MKLRFFFILSFFFNYSLVFPAEKLKPDTFSIDEVYVTRVRPADRDVSVASLQSLDSHELHFINGNTAADAIKNFSGVSLKDYGGIGGFKTVMVRSLGANHTGVFIDGVQLSDAANGQIDLGKINTENASSVSLYIGQPNDMLQPARMYASAYVLQLSSNDISKNLKPFTFSAGVKTGSFGLINPSLVFENKWSKALNSSFNLNYTKAEGNYPFKISLGEALQQKEYRQNSETESLNLNTDLAYWMKDSSKFSCKIYFYNSSRGLPGAAILYNSYSSQQLWNSDFFTNVKYEKRTAQRWNYLTNIKFSQNYLRYYDKTLNSSGIIDNRYMQQEYYVSQAVSYNIVKSFNLSLASDLIVNAMNANLPKFALPLRYTSLTAFSANYKFNRFETFGTMLSSLIHESTRNINSKSAKNRKVLSPGLGASLLIFQNPSIRLRFLYKDIFRMPTFDDLYYTQIGNVNLKPERAKQYSAGLSAYWAFWLFDYFSLKAEVFQNIVTDKIIAIPTNNLFIWSMHNIGIVSTRGFELNAGFQSKTIYGIKWYFSSNYSFQRAHDMSDKQSSTYNQQIPYIPYENFSMLNTFSFGSCSFSWNSIFNGYRYTLGENVFANMLPSWWVQDINLSYKFGFKSMNMKAKAEVNNLFNKQYDVVKSFPMPGRSYNFSIILSY